MRFNIGLIQPAARALRPVIPDNARGPRITAAAGPVVEIRPAPFGAKKLRRIIMIIPSS